MSLLPHCSLRRIQNAKVVDYEVRRYPVPVSLVLSRSFQKRPTLETSVENDCFVAGGLGGGWATKNMVPKACARKRAYVCGLESRNSLIQAQTIVKRPESTESSPTSRDPIPWPTQPQVVPRPVLSTKIR